MTETQTIGAGDVAKLSGKALDKRNAELASAYAAILDNEKPEGLAVSDPELVTREILERIMNAETFDEAFKPQELTAWRDLIDVPVRVLGFKLNPSGLEGQAVYAVVELERLDGDMDNPAKLTVTCGGRNVMMQLVKALEKGWLQNPVAMTKKATSEGYEVLWLIAAGNPLDEV
jgi:hypothetical protein